MAVVGPIAAAFVILSVLAIYNFNKLEAGYRVFQVADRGISDYQPGTLVLATDQFGRPLAIGDIVVFSEETSGQPQYIMAVIEKAPNSVVQEVYTVRKADGSKATVSGEAIKYKITHKAFSE